VRLERLEVDGRGGYQPAGHLGQAELVHVEVAGRGGEVAEPLELRLPRLPDVRRERRPASLGNERVRRTATRTSWRNQLEPLLAGLGDELQPPTDTFQAPIERVEHRAPQLGDTSRLRAGDGTCTPKHPADRRG
jgi:hypothetical protein